MTSIDMCRLLGSIHIGQTAIGTAIGTRSGNGQRMTGETAVAILLFVEIPLSVATVALQLLVAAVENVSAQGTESRTGDAVGPLAAEVGLDTE